MKLQSSSSTMLLQVSPTKKSCLSKQKSFQIPYSRLSFYFLTSSVTILILLQVQALKLFLPPFSLSPSRPWPPSSPPLSFLPLKDLNLAATAMEGNTWFMGSLNYTQDPGEPKHLFFPSPQTNNSLLCISGRDASNGTRNRYALARPGSVPVYGARTLPGLTFVSDTYYDYENPFHGLTAVAPFVAWHQRKGCVVPARWVLYHHGELRKSMSRWVGSVAEAVFGEKNMIIEKFEPEDGEDKISCFERAVVFRHNEGSMSRERKEEVYGMIRCKARAYCNVSRVAGDETAVRLTLLLRTGARSFRDEAAVVRIFDRECKKVDGCRLQVARPNNLTFCDQVKLMRSTDILASPHGAQLTNMFLMDKNSSVMEFFPKGWLELAGAGQYVFQWVGISSGIRHTGTWHDPDGEECPNKNDPAKCFSFYKDGRIGHDEEYFGRWAADVIGGTKDYKQSEEARKIRQQESSSPCQCD